jgi:hypothetical protein
VELIVSVFFVIASKIDDGLVGSPDWFVLCDDRFQILIEFQIVNCANCANCATCLLLRGRDN